MTPNHHDANLHPNGRLDGLRRTSDQQMTTREQLRWMAGFYRPYVGRISASVAIAAMSSFLLLPIPLLIRSILDRALPSRDVRQLSWLVAGIVLLHGLGSASQLLETLVATSITKRIRIDVQTAIYDHLQRMPISFFSKNHTGKLLTMVMLDVGSLNPLMPTATLALVKSAITSFSVVLVLARISPQLTVIIVGVAPVLLFTYNLLRRRIFKASMQFKVSQEKVTSFMQEDLRGALLTQSFGTEIFRRRYALKAISQSENASRNVLVKMGYATASGVILTLTYNLVLWGYGGWAVIASTTTLGTLVAFSAYIGRIDGPVKAMVASNIGITSALASAERLASLLAEEPPIRSLEGSGPIVVRAGEIAMRGVRFSHAPEAPLFRDFDLVLPGSKVSALVGRTGVGKTSLLQLIPRLHDVDGGSITIDGQNVREVELGSLRKNIAIVHQDTFLFNTTIRENLLMGRTDIPESSIVRICEYVGIHPFIASLPKGYDSEIAESAVNLSGGQKQRLAIARALLSNAPIVLMDEFTSALDSHTERSFHPKLKELFRGRTVVIVTHNPSTLELADHVFRLVPRDGVVVAEVATREEAIHVDPLEGGCDFALPSFA